MVDHGVAIGPCGTSVKVNGKIVAVEIVDLGCRFDGPVGIHNSAHHLAQFVFGGTVETSLLGSSPGSVSIIDNVSDLL